jgi:hypothetical protein
MSIVLVIISIVAAGTMVTFTASLQKRQIEETQTKLAAIQKALFDYRLGFNRIPCPADVTIATQNLNFGNEAANPGVCNGGVPAANFIGGSEAAIACNSSTVPYLALALTESPHVGDILTGGTMVTNGYLPAGSLVLSMIEGPQSARTQWWLTVNNTPASGHVESCSFLKSTAPVEGMVPTKTLRLPDDFAFDGWGRRIMYAVSKDFTQPGAFGIINVFDTAGRMTILNAEDVAKTTFAAYALTSFGANGHGAFPRGSGTTNLNVVTSRINVGSTNIDEQNNCDCDSNAVATGFDGVFVQKDATLDPASKLNGFDDIVVFATRVDLSLKSTFSPPVGIPPNPPNPPPETGNCTSTTATPGHLFIANTFVEPATGSIISGTIVTNNYITANSTVVAVVPSGGNWDITTNNATSVSAGQTCIFTTGGGRSSGQFPCNTMDMAHVYVSNAAPGIGAVISGDVVNNGYIAAGSYVTAVTVYGGGWNVTMNNPPLVPEATSCMFSGGSGGGSGGGGPGLGGGGCAVGCTGPVCDHTHPPHCVCNC